MKRKLSGIILSLCMVLSLLPIGAKAAASFSDMPAENHWAYEALTAATDNGLLQGSSGRLMPEDNLTRAQLAAILNRAFGASSVADISGYSDVKETEWYYNDIAKAVRMGTLTGYSGIMQPESAVTREQAFTALARALKLDGGNMSSLDMFSDKASVSPWAIPALAAMAQSGYIHGMDGRLNPAGRMTREQFAQVMFNVFACYIDSAGTYSDSIDGNVLVRTGDVTLKNLTITGDLILGEGVGNGDVTLDGVTVTGRVVVRGGGENSIHIINRSDVGNIVVGKTGDGGVRIRTEEGCRVEVVYIDDGLDDIVLEGTFNQVAVETNAPVVLRDATVTGLTVSGAGADVKLDGNTSVSVTQITGGAEVAKLEISGNAKITKLESAASGVKVSGDGTVTQAFVSGDNTSIDISGAKVTVEAGTTDVTQHGNPVSPGVPSSPPVDEVIPHAAEVTSLAALQAALADSSVTAVTIKESILIPSETNVTFSKPVTIADLPGSILTVSGSLVNNSTFTNRGLGGDFSDTGLLLEEGSFTNNGTFVNDSRFSQFLGTFTNSTGGIVRNKNWFHSIGSSLANNGDFSNMGDITLINSSAFGEGDHATTFTNASGATFVSDGPGSVLVSSTCSFINAGSATVNYFDNYGTLTNTGSFTYTGILMSAGSIDGDAELTPGTEAKFVNYLPVTEFDALEPALDSPDTDYVGVAVTGSITLEGDLAFGRHVLIAPDGELIIPSGYTLTITSADGYNELMVRGRLLLDGGTLVTTQVGEDDDADIGQVTILGGALEAENAYSIINDGVILFISGYIQDDLVVDGSHDIVFMQNIVGVSGEEELLSAMADDSVDEIEIVGSFTLTEDLDITKRTTVTYDSLEGSPRTLTISSGATVTVRDGGYLSILGDVVNNGTIVNNSGMFAGIGGSLINGNTGILNINNHFDIIEGTLTNSGSINVSAVGDSVILLRGGVLVNNAGATLISEGSVDLDSSEGMDGVTVPHEPTFTNAGVFNNGALPSSQAYFGMRTGTLNNTGTFVNNCHMDLRYTDFIHTGEHAYFATYTGDLMITGGSLTTTGAADGTFNNEGYMSITDEYGKDGRNNICTIDVDNGDLDNDSNWLEYIAAVYSEGGLGAAEDAQTSKIEDLIGDNYFGLAVYNRLQVLGDITVASDRALTADFGSYWIGSTWSWDGTQDIQTPAELTINPNITLTVPAGCSLNVESGIVDNKGIIIISPALDEDDLHRDAGCVDVWPNGTFTNTGTLTVYGDFNIRHEYDADDNDIIMPAISGLGSVPANFIAMVYSESDLLEANSCTAPVYDRIEIKGSSDISLTGADTLTIYKNIYIEPGSGLIIPYGKELELTGEHWFSNDGDISVFGHMLIGDGSNSFNIFNRGIIEIGALSGAQEASVTVSENSFIANDGVLNVYATGSLVVTGHVHAGRLNNYGNVTISAAGFLGIFGDFSVFATGSLDIDGNAVLNDNGALQNNGSINVGANGTLDASEGRYDGELPFVADGGTFIEPQ